MKFIFSVH